MLDLDDRLNPDDDEAASRPLTPQDRRNGSLFLVTFIVWLPVYLFVVRPLMNDVLFQYISSYPAMVHLVPIFGVPWLLMEIFAWFGKTRSGPSNGAAL